MFCPHCGAERKTKAATCEHCGAVLRRRKWPVVLVTSLLVVALGIVGFFVGSRHLAMVRLNEKLEEAVGRDSGYTETILRIEAESSSMTYAELFSICEKSIADRTNLIVELRGLYPEIDSDLKASLVEHLAAENELIRQKMGFYRKQMEAGSALEIYTDHLADLPSSSYGWDYYQTRAAKLKGEATEAASEMVSKGTQFVKTYETLVGRERSLAEQMDQAGLRFVRVFEQYKTQNVEKAQEAIKTMQGLEI